MTTGRSAPSSDRPVSLARGFELRVGAAERAGRDPHGDDGHDRGDGHADRDLRIAPLAVEQGPRSIHRMRERVERAQRLEPGRRERHRQQDPRQQQQWHRDALDERGKGVLALEDQRRRVRERGDGEPDQHEQGEHDGDAGQIHLVDQSGSRRR